ncbi:MAG: hypothetical protein FJ088_01640 [Deltaproteobacteria bacterium]|nr:hypothetical protein [Deltaproteobacteria bacterium]
MSNAQQSSFRVLISDKVSESCGDILRHRHIAVDYKTGLAEDQLVSIIGEYDALIVRSATKVTEKVLKAGGKLKAVGRAGSGVDNIDVKAATAAKILVMNTPGGNTVSTAEHAVAMLFAAARRIPQADASMKAGKWEKTKFMGGELYGRTAGVIGAGKIGAVVIDRLCGLKMNVIAYDPFLSHVDLARIGAYSVGFDELVASSDFITVHVPLNDKTRNLINADALAKMRNGVILVNCARGGIVNEKDLLDALNGGKVACAALDVFEKEPPEFRELIDHPKVIATPHIAASTDQAQENVALAIAEQVADYLLTGAVSGAVNSV